MSDSGKERLYAYDLVRVVAMVFVVATHSLMVVDTESPLGALYRNVGQLLFITANALFFMMSGKFNCRIHPTKDGLISYYIKRFRGFVIPIAVYFFIRTLFEVYPNFESLSHVAKAYVANTLSVFSGNEYWFVFSLFGCIVVAPFLARMTDGMERPESLAFFIVGAVYSLIVVVSLNTGIEFNWGYLFTGFSFAFCLGALMPKLAPTKQSENRWIVAALISFAAGVLLRISGWGGGSTDISPFFTISSIGMYLAIIRVASRMKPSKVVSFLARHSFGVYLTHMMILWPIMWNLPPVSGMETVFLHFGITLMVSALAVVFSIVVDALLVQPLQRGFDRMSQLFAKSDDAAM